MAKKNKGKGKSTGVTTTSAPAATGTKAKRTNPTVSVNNQGTMVISHTEFMSDVYMSTATSEGRSFTINPQSSTTFTWLSALATRFEMYRFKKLKVHYKPSCSTTVTGYVIIGIDFDAYDEIPDKVAMLAWQHSSKSAAWQSTTVDASKSARLQTDRYLDTSSRGDRRLDDIGNIVVLTNGPVAGTVGEVFIEYTIELKIPALREPPPLYSTIQNPAIDGVDGYFRNISSPTGVLFDGNMNVKAKDQNKLFVFDEGKYYLTTVCNSTGVTLSPEVTVSAPTNNPTADWKLTVNYDKLSGGWSIVGYELEVINAPVLLTIAALAATAAVSFTLYMSTYKYNPAGNRKLPGSL